MPSNGDRSAKLPTAIVISLEASPEDLTLRLSGDLDLSSSPQFETALERALAAAPGRLVLDLRGVSFLDSCGLRALLAAQHQCEHSGCALTLLAGDQAKRLFELTGVSDSLPLGEAPPAGETTTT